MSDYIFGREVEFDLDDIWEYIAVDNMDAADRSIDKLFGVFEALGKTPGMGHKRTDLTPHQVLSWPVGAYLIVYRAEQQPVEIIAVTQGSRDIPAFLRRRLRH